MQQPRMTTRSWMVVVASVALMSWGIRSDGFRALVWEAPILAAALAIWMVKRKQPFAARVLGGSVLLWLIIGLALPSIHVEMAVGHTNVRIFFVVLDADTGHPLEGASIHQRDADFADSPGLQPYNLDLETGTDGSASVLLSLQFTSVTESMGRRLRSFHVRYPYWDIRVLREGYQEVTTPFAAYENGNHRFHDGASPVPLSPPPIVIRLQKQGPAR